MRDLRARASIHSSPADVFRVVTNFRAYVDWNPWLKDIAGVKGEVEEGDLVSVRISVASLFGLRLTYCVERMRAPDTLFLQGESRFNFLFSIQREYQILTKSEGAAIYSAGLKIKGPLAGIIKFLFGELIRHALKKEANSLKKYCEAHYPLSKS